MPPVFKDCTIALSGTFEDTHKNIGNQVASNGGTHSNKVTNTCTHLVVTTKDFEAKSAKVQQASNNSEIKVVSYEWLVDSISARKKASEEKYKMAQPAVKDVGKKGKKRARSETPVAAESASKQEQEQQKPPDKKLKNGQSSTSRPITVPVDEVLRDDKFVVFIDDDGTIYDANLNQTVSGANANKFYKVQILKERNGELFHTYTRWGRVGERGQDSFVAQKVGLEYAKAMFEKKFREKTGHPWANRLNPPKNGKYTFLERNYDEDSDEENDADKKPLESSNQQNGRDTRPDEPESTLSEPVQSLIQLIFNIQFMSATMNEMNYDANKLPLGKLSKRTLMAGFEKLKALAELLVDASLATSVHQMGYNDAIGHLSDAYYTVIPHIFGRHRPPTIATEEMLKKEIVLLESLSDLGIANEIMKDSKIGEGKSMHALDRHYSRLEMEEMTPLESNTNEFKLLQDYLLNTRGSTHNLNFKLQEIFRIERKGEGDRFAKSPYASIPSDRRLLWHGSRCTNYGGILSQGLRIAPPEAPVSGYMFGKGVYLADMSSKSANYCNSYSSGKIALLLLCEAELGKPMYEVTHSSYQAGEEAKAKGCVATWGQGTTGPVGWKDAGCVHNNLKGILMPDTTKAPGPTTANDASLLYNEYIVYDVAQIRLRYLLRVEIS